MAQKTFGDLQASWDEKGFVIHLYPDVEVFNFDHMKQAFQHAAEIYAEKPVPIRFLTITPKIRHVNLVLDAKTYQHGLHMVRSVAWVTSDKIPSVIGNNIIRQAAELFPIKVFTFKDQAESWLLEH